MWFFSWFFKRLTLLFQYLVIQYKGFWFDYDAKYAIKQKTNRQTLFNILNKHKNTKFLREQMEKANINQIDTIETFKRLFPNYTSYSDYESYVEEIRNNGSKGDIMGVGFPLALTNTTGTTGTPKNYPVYFLDINEAYYICYMLTKSVPSNLLTGCKVIPLNSLHRKTHVTKDKLKTYKLSAISTIAVFEKQNVETLLKFNQNVIPSIISREVEDLTDLLLFILLWTLQSRDIEVITSTFISTFVNFFTILEQKFEFICEHIEKGKLPSDDSLSSPLPVDLRLALEAQEYRLQPNPTRAQELRNIVREHGFLHISRHIWPNLKCGITIISQTIRQFEMKFRSTYWDPTVPIFPYVYGMSEHHRIAIPRTSDSYQLIPIPRSVYYEFIEVENDDDDDDDEVEGDKPPQSLELHQLEEGKCYEVVLTTYNGLYRYRTEDIVRVTGYYYALPMWELFGRRGQYLSVANEHVTEIELRHIIDSIANQYKNEFSASSPQYSVFIEKKSYVLAMELDPDKSKDAQQFEQMTSEICLKFDQQLQQSNDEYKKCRDKKKIAAPSLLWVKCNTLTTGTREFRARKTKGSGANQLKSQLIISSKNKDVIKFIKDNRISE